MGWMSRVEVFSWFGFFGKKVVRRLLEVLSTGGVK